MTDLSNPLLLIETPSMKNMRRCWAGRAMKVQRRDLVMAHQCLEKAASVVERKAGGSG